MKNSDSAYDADPKSFQGSQEPHDPLSNFDSRRRALLLGGLGTALLSGLGGLALPGVSRAQQAWPSRPIRFVSATAPGGAIDATGRAYGDFIFQKTGQPVILEARPGGNSMIAADFVARSAPDGHTWLFAVNSALTQAPILLKQAAVPNPAKTFTMLAGFSPGPALLLVKRDLPAKNIKEFVELARRQRLTIGSIGVGSRAHLFGAQMNKQLGAQIDIIHYKGAAPAMQDLAGGQIDCGISSYTGSLPHMQSGRMRAIAVVSGSRTPKMPELSTFADEGFTQPAFRLRDWLALAAPAQTPRPIIERMGALIREGIDIPAVQRARDNSAVTEAPLVLEEFEKALAEERPVWEQITRDLGVTL